MAGAAFLTPGGSRSCVCGSAPRLIGDATRPRRGKASDDRHEISAKCGDSRTSASPAHRPLHLALLLALADGFALVVDVLAAGERDLDLRVRALEVDARRHHGQAP